MSARIARVLVDSPLPQLDRLLDYEIPEGMDGVEPGVRVIVPLRTALATYASTYYRDRTAPDPAQMTRLMQQAVDRVLGTSGARVLLANIIYQRRHN